MKNKDPRTELASHVSRETLERLDAFAALVSKWSARINLISRKTLPEIWSRHILDSAQIFDLKPEHAAHWLDIGSGGGFPGIVIAILAAETNPNLKISLIESDLRKCVFLRTAVRELGLAATVLNTRAEDGPALSADVISARALAPLDTLLALSHRHLAPGGVMLFPKGRENEAELRKALETWRCDCEKIAISPQA